MDRSVLSADELNDLGIRVYHSPKRQTFKERVGKNTSCINLPGYAEYVCRMFDQNEIMFVLLAANVAPLNALFGKADGLFRYECNNYYWRFEFQGYRFTLFSGEGKGSSLEIDPTPIASTPHTPSQAAVAFAEILFNLLKPFREEALEKMRQNS